MMHSVVGRLKLHVVELNNYSLLGQYFNYIWFGFWFCVSELRRKKGIGHVMTGHVQLGSRPTDLELCKPLCIFYYIFC